MGMDFFIPFLFPNFGNGCFSFPSRSRIMGMGFSHSLPVSKLWKWIFSFPSRSRTCHNTDRNQNGNWSTVRDTRLPMFSASSSFFTTIYIDEVKWAKEFSCGWLKRQGVLLSSVANIYAAKVLEIVNKIILFLFIDSGRDNDKKRGDYQEWRRMGLRIYGLKLLLKPHIF